MKTFADLEKEIEVEIVDTHKIMNELDKIYGKDWSINNAIEYSYEKAKQDLLKEVKKIIANEIDILEAREEISQIQNLTIKSHLGISEAET